MCVKDVRLTKFRVFLFLVVTTVFLLIQAKLNFNIVSLADFAVYLGINTVHDVVILNSSQGSFSVQHDGNFKILFWTKSFYGFGDEWFGVGAKPFEKCVYNSCVATADKSQYNSSDVILFTMWFLSRHWQDVPAYKFDHQRWVMHTMESPANEDSLSRYNDLFNVTWTYSRQSDVQSLYAYTGNRGYRFLKKRNRNTQILRKNYAEGRSKLVAWFVSRCSSQSRREYYVTNLRNYISVDIYGTCGSHTCSRRNSRLCDDMIRRTYKFYLSFENSICRDYVTEKLWRAIHLELLPVVLGGAHYDDILPKHSYIDVKDFRTPKQLGEYLLLLDKNNTLYNSYFAWKADYELKPNPPDQCALCQYITKSANISKVYNLDQTWSKESECHEPEVYYREVEPESWKWNPIQKHIFAYM